MLSHSQLASKTNCGVVSLWHDLPETTIRGRDETEFTEKKKKRSLTSSNIKYHLRYYHILASLQTGLESERYEVIFLADEEKKLLFIKL